MRPKQATVAGANYSLSNTFVGLALEVARVTASFLEKANNKCVRKTHAHTKQSVLVEARWSGKASLASGGVEGGQRETMKPREPRDTET